MALSSKAIQTKIRSVKNIKKITRAMELVSVSKMKKSTSRALRTRAYATLALELLTSLSKNRKLKHPLLERGGDKTLILFIASNKGLCGSFNVALSKEIINFYKEKIGTDRNKSIDFITVGKNAERVVKRLGAKLVASFVNLKESAGIYEQRGLTQVVLEEYKKGEYNRVIIAYNHFISSISIKQEMRRLLPVSPENLQNMIEESRHNKTDEDTKDFSLSEKYIFEPSEEELLDEVLPRLTEMQIYEALLESWASEHSSRMMAMKNATDNAGSLIEELTLSFNKSRQNSITQEISEIASGAISV